MKMKEGENIVQYYGRVKEVVNSIIGARGIINDETMIRKVLRTLLHIYAIRVSTNQELGYAPGNDLTLDWLIGRLTTF